MKVMAFIMSLFVAGVGALGTVSPEKIVAWGRKFESPGGLLTAAALRIALGTALLCSAEGSRLPSTVRSIGAATIAAGVATPAIGVRRFGRALQWWTRRRPLFRRSWTAMTLGLGLFLAWTVAPRR